jgi:pyruvate carboxylase
MIACAAAGADVVDVAIDSMSGMTSQPAMGAVCAALEQTEMGTGIRYADIQGERRPCRNRRTSETVVALNLYWTQLRLLYSCFDANGASNCIRFVDSKP